MKKKTCLLKKPSANGATIRAVLLRLLSKRDYSTHELTTKLQKRGFLLGDIDAALKSLQDVGYLDDKQFTKHYVKTRYERGFGPKRIEFELKLRGIDASIIAEQLEIPDNDWLISMQTLLAKKMRGHSLQDLKQKAKVVHFFVNRGFTNGQIIQLLGCNELE